MYRVGLRISIAHDTCNANSRLTSPYHLSYKTPVAGKFRTVIFFLRNGKIKVAVRHVYCLNIYVLVMNCYSVGEGGA